MQVTPTQFRAQFGIAFADTSLYSNDLIQSWLTEAYNNMNARVWLSSLDLYAMLRAAHFIVLNTRAAQAAANGGIPGQSGGVLQSKSVGPVSASYDTSIGLDPTALSWNLTVYGQQYWRKAKLAGMGGRLSLFC
jgi:hypothetical protein